MQKALLVIGVPHEPEYVEMVGGYLKRVLKPKQVVSFEYPGRVEELTGPMQYDSSGRFWQGITPRVLEKTPHLKTVEHAGLYLDHAGLVGGEEYEALTLKRSSEFLRQARENGSHALVIGYTHARDLEHYANLLRKKGIFVKVKYCVPTHEYIQQRLKQRAKFLENLPRELHSIRDGFGVVPIEPHRREFKH